jgi:5-methylcytosine-specific restriction endonuclease McrA
MPKSPCIEAKCPNYARPKSPRCDEHTRKRERERSRDRRRRGFNYNGMKWRRTSRRYRFENPLCEKCGELAEDVHHIQSPFHGGAPYLFDNLMSLCKRCHGQTHGDSAA